MEKNIDAGYIFNDGGGNDYQRHLLAFINLVLRNSYKEIKFDKLIFKTIKKFGRGNLNKRIRQIKVNSKTIIKKGKKSDIYAGGNRLCFEDINLFYKATNGDNNHIFIQVKGTSNHLSRIYEFKKIIKNFYNNYNYQEGLSLFFIICNVKINQLLKEYISSSKKDVLDIDLLHLFTDLILTKKKVVTKAILELINKGLNGVTIDNDGKIKIKKFFGINYEQVIPMIIKYKSVLSNIVIIEDISFSEIEKLLKDYYGESYDKVINISKELSSRKTIKTITDADFEKYLYYDKTQFLPLQDVSKLKSIEDGGFLGIV